MFDIQNNQHKRQKANAAFLSTNPHKYMDRCRYHMKKPRSSFKNGDNVECDFIVDNIQETMGGEIMEVHDNEEYDVKLCDGEILRLPFNDLRMCSSTLSVSPGEIPFIQGQKVEVKKDSFWVEGKLNLFLKIFIYSIDLSFCFI